MQRARQVKPKKVKRARQVKQEEVQVVNSRADSDNEWMRARVKELEADNMKFTWMLKDKEGDCAELQHKVESLKETIGERDVDAEELGKENVKLTRIVAALEEKIEKLEYRVIALGEDAAGRLSEYNVLQGASEQPPRAQTQCKKYRMMLYTVFHDIAEAIEDTNPVWNILVRNVKIPSDSDLAQWRLLPGANGLERDSLSLSYVYRGENEEDTLRWCVQ